MYYRLFLVSFCFFALSGCSLQDKLRASLTGEDWQEVRDKRKERKKKRKAARLILKAQNIHPETFRVDTVEKEVATVTKEIQVDTIIDKRIDSVTLIKDNLIIQYRNIDGAHHITGTVLSDTIYQTVKVPCETIHIEEEAWWERIWWWWILLVIIGLFILWRKIKT